MTDHPEFEIKLRLAVEDVEPFAMLHTLWSGEPEIRKQRSVYFDDDRGRLAARGLELRVRASGGAYVQTIKEGLGVQRSEWETLVDGEAPERPREGPAERAFKQAGKLCRQFTVDVERRIWRAQRDKSVVEISLDFGEIACERGRQPIAEAEIELKSGGPEALFDFARRAVTQFDAPPSLVGKALRGRLLQRGVADEAHGAIAIDLRESMTAAEAFRAICDGCLLHCSWNEEALRRRPGDMEASHQLRVAIRRLRAALTLFEQMIAGPALEALKAELKWISDLLGAARDLDVLVDQTIAELGAAHFDVRSLARLFALCEERRTRAHAELEAALRSQRFRLLLLQAIEFAHVGGWASDPEPHKSRLREKKAEAFAAKRLEGRLENVVGKKAGKQISGGLDTERHRLRIEAKKLRYMGQFFEALAPSKRFRDTDKTLKAVQKSLGLAHDGVVADQILSDLLAVDNEVSLSFAASKLRADLKALEPKRLAAAEKARLKLKQKAPFWRNF